MRATSGVPQQDREGIKFFGAALQWGAAKPEFVAVAVAVGGLADPIRVGFPLHGGEPPLSDLRDAPVEVVDEHQVPGVPSVLGPPLDEDVPAVRELPYSLSVGGEERRRQAEEPLVPVQAARSR